MSSSPAPPNGSPEETSWWELVAQVVNSGEVFEVVLTRPAEPGARRITVRPINSRKGRQFQWATRTATQERHENLAADELLTRLRATFPETFADARLQHTAGVTSATQLRDGRLKTRFVPQAPLALVAGHNRSKNYILPEGVPCPYLIELGVMTAEGKVKAARYDKFRQINRYLEFVRDIVPQLPETGPLKIVDFGCGKSYLSFATYDLFRRVLGREARLVGLDRRSDVIATCQTLSTTLNWPGLSFAVGDIATFEPTDGVDLAISLHACDTATDDALLAAVAWHTRVIFAVPCCQHELNPQLASPALEAMLRHGLLRERLAALTTDALRAAALECAGYKTQMLEFIDLEHTPKNILIRAVRRTQPLSVAQQEERRVQYAALKQLVGLARFRLDALVDNET